MVRVWRRRLLGGMGTAMIVPGTLLASLALLAAAGGFGGLSALGQAFSGPSLPASGAVVPHAGHALPRAVPPALVAALSAPGSSASTRGAGGGATPASGSPTPGPGQGTSSGSPPQSQSGSGQAPGPTRTSTSRPAPGPQPTAVDRVVSAGTAVTSQIPGPVGPAATKALQTAGSTVDSIAPIRSPIKSP